MKLLGIETAAEACSVALWNDGEILDRVELGARQHAKVLLPMIEDCYLKAD